MLSDDDGGRKGGGDLVGGDADDCSLVGDYGGEEDEGLGGLGIWDLGDLGDFLFCFMFF